MQEQYVFVYDALLEALAVGDTAIPCSLYMQRYTELKRQNPSTGKSQCHEEFEVILFRTSKHSESSNLRRGFLCFILGCLREL